MTTHKAIGQQGEIIAQNYLIAQGCTILHTNYHSRYGEIDIIAEDRAGVLLFIEVKYRKNEFFASAASSVTPQKLQKIEQTIACYLQQYPTRQPLRIDLITIIGQSPYQIDWLQNITL